jgi:hypothetical protein
VDLDGNVAAYDQVMADLAERFPYQTVLWRQAWLLRAAHYLKHNGDMTDAPPLPRD